MATPVRRTDAAPARRRHLLDPEHLALSHASTQSSVGALTSVQQWVLSVLATTTILHFAVGLVLAAMFLEGADVSAQVGLNVLASVVGVLAVAAGRAIHRRSPLSPWLVVGVLPGLIGAFLTFR